ncbi:MAG: peptidylprolyl isomerase [Brevundimonas sp.]|uniref:peptidylprolyl isomerase n=1 Tax=Brevundimonas sp. TaxID=1871086 RepID=UPI0025BF97CF|nr:peptidylprolyl isomerase [Brevundimonas sp.]MBX3476443.1 peptidylprolyl isomerase [Brevundimonas sp.]
MGLRVSTAVFVAAMLATPALAQNAPTQGQTAAGALNPGAESAPPAPTAEPQFQLADGIVATVNDAIITGFDVRQRMLMLIAMTQVQPTQENLPAIQQQALNALVDERLRAAEIARFDSLVISDEDVDRELADMAQQVGTTAENYIEYLSEAGIRPSTLREQMRVDIGWRELVGGRFASRARVGQAQIDQALRQANEAASKPQYLVGEIFIEAARVGGQQAAMTGAQQLVNQMVQGAPFQAVARQFSSAPSAAQGGDAGWLVQGTINPQLQTAIEALEVGQLSNPIPVEGGVYIIYLRDKRTGLATNLVSLKQVMIELPETATEAEVEAASARLTALQPQLTCDTILTRARSESGLLGTDLGEADVQNLAPQFQQIARSGEIGSVSGPVRTPLGLHLIAVCGRRIGGPEAPTRQEIEFRLRSANLSMLARRYMRDLRADALIETK